VLADLVRFPTQSAVADVEEEFGQERRLGEALASHDALGELPTRIFGQTQRLPD